MKFVLQAQTADGLPFWVGEGGPTIVRANAVEFGAELVETRRAGACYVFDMEFEVVEVGTAADLQAC